MDILSLLGEWLLFTFPMYQGLMELDDYRNFFSKFDNYRMDYKKISPWFWILPPLKIILERNRAMKVIKKFVTSEHDIKVLMSFIDKATAWYYVSLGGWFKVVTSIYEILTENHVKLFIPVFLVLIIIATSSGFISAYYRIGSHRRRKMISKFQKY